MDVYIVITEEWYGGAEAAVRTFTTLERAKAYQEALIQKFENKKDVAVIKCRMNDPDNGCERMADDPAKEDEPEYYDE